MNIGENGEKLPGVKKKSFAMFFGGGEIWFEHLDGMYCEEKLVLEKLSADSVTFRRPSKPSLICFNLDETTVTDAIENEIVKSLTAQGKVFTHVCFVGADKRRAKTLSKSLSGFGFAVAFINDFEKAKEWLVSDGVY